MRPSPTPAHWRWGSHHYSPGVLGRGSGVPWNESRQSFSTKERPVIYAKKMQKVMIFQEKG